MARDLLVLRGNLALGRWRVPERPRRHAVNGVDGLARSMVNGVDEREKRK